MLIYDSGRGRNRNIKRDEKRVSATSNFVMEMEFGNETLIFDLQHNSDIVNSGLNSKFPAFCIQSPVKQVVVFLERDALVNMKDVQVDTVWVKH
jgi:hypothetical protein